MPAPGPAESIAAYDSLAEEYDGPQHRTTRELERLSALALHDSTFLVNLDRGNGDIVELGCGTGALSREIVKGRKQGCLVLTDPAPQMLRRAVVRLDDRRSGMTTEPLVGPADEIVSRLTRPADAIVAGLADPYLSETLLRRLLRVCTPQTMIFVTVPSRRWAIDERQGRLSLPLDRTRFRAKDGKVVYSRSLALDPSELASMFVGSGVAVIECGSLRGEKSGLNPRPEISWAVGRPVLAPIHPG